MTFCIFVAVPVLSHRLVINLAKPFTCGAFFNNMKVKESEKPIRKQRRQVSKKMKMKKAERKKIY
jgi:hypothetical protein